MVNPIKKNYYGEWIPGSWMPKLEGKYSTYVVLRKNDLINYLGETIYEVEIKEIVEETADHVNVKSVRLLRKIESWNVRTARLFSAYCAENVLPIFEIKYPEDRMPRKVISAVKNIADGMGNERELEEIVSAIYKKYYRILNTPEGMAVESAAYSTASKMYSGSIYLQNKYLNRKLEKNKQGDHLWGGRDAYYEEWESDSILGKLFAKAEASVLSKTVTTENLIFYCAFRTAQIARFCIEDAIKKNFNEIKLNRNILIKNIGDIELQKRVQANEEKIINDFPIETYRELLKNSLNPDHEAYKKEYEYQTDKLFDLIESH